ncbi:MAG: response regulator [Acidimicrobiales bacterium]|nr:response regulator [Acidimicrobiales bacterium]
MLNKTSPVVLVIDDEPLMVRLLRVLLEDEGYTVFEAMTGPIGLALVPAISPDVVVLDVMMPGMDGVEVCTRVAAGFPELPVIIVTARDDRELEERCQAAGARHFLTKPLAPGRLEELLRSLVCTPSVAEPETPWKAEYPMADYLPPAKI